MVGMPGGARPRISDCGCMAFASGLPHVVLASLFLLACFEMYFGARSSASGPSEGAVLVLDDIPLVRPKAAPFGQSDEAVREKVVSVPLPAPETGPYLDYSSRTCSIHLRNFTGFCPEGRAAAGLARLRKANPGLFRLPLRRVRDALEGRVVFFVGDSLMEQSFHSMHCMVYDQATPSPDTKPPETFKWDQPSLGKAPLRCVPILGGRSISCFLHCATRVDWTLTLAESLRFVVARLAGPEDVVIFNTGAHFTPNLHFPGNQPQAVQRALNFARAYRQLHQQHGAKGLPLIMYREMTAQHFKSTGGWFPAWRRRPKDASGSYFCHPQLRDRKAMLKVGYFEFSPRQTENVMNDEMLPIIKDHGIPVLTAWDTTSDPSLHSGYHKFDCTHFCLPGPPDVWNLRLLERLIADPSPANPLPRQTGPFEHCRSSGKGKKSSGCRGPGGAQTRIVELMRIAADELLEWKTDEKLRLHRLQETKKRKRG